MKRREPPSKEAFDKLLLWLDPDRDKAAEKYERIQFRLIRIFAARGCSEAEDLADETFNVVAQKIDGLLANYVGDPALYFYAVAKKIYLEWLKRKPVPDIPPPPDKTEIERECNCLDQCLEQLATPAESELLYKYHEKEKQEKIWQRKRLAEELGISINALRIRVCHLHARLRPCIDQCLQQFTDE